MTATATLAPAHDAFEGVENGGAYIFRRGFLDAAELAEAVRLAQAFAARKRNVHDRGRYAGLQWYQVDLDPALPVCAKLLAELDVPTPKLMVFYYLEPGATIHPHRDLTGAGLNNRIRFHLPIVTNRLVDFRVSGDLIRMEAGDLWCLDTSYRHSVHNGGAETRVHIVVECEITPGLRRRLRRDAAARFHDILFVGAMGFQFTRAIFRNIFTDPAYFRDQMKMVARFVGWRFLKIGEPR